MLNQNVTTTPTLISGGSDESNWDFAAVSSYLIDSTQQGVLILDGDVDDDCDDDCDIVQHDQIVDGNDKSENELSYPDSIPTEIGSLQGSQHNDAHGTYYSKLKWIWILGISTMVVGIPTITTGILFFNRQQLLQRNLDLEREIEHVRKEIVAAQNQNAMVVSTTRRQNPRLIYDQHDNDEESKQDESKNSDTKFKLIDNCWFKAELELRQCANEAKDSFSETAEMVYDYFAGSSSSSSSDNKNNNNNAPAHGEMNDDKQSDTSSSGSNTNVDYCALASDASEAVTTAAAQVIDTLWSIWSDVWEDPVVQDAVEQTRDTIRDALPDQQIYFKHN